MSKALVENACAVFPSVELAECAAAADADFKAPESPSGASEHPGGWRGWWDVAALLVPVAWLSAALYHGGAAIWADEEESCVFAIIIACVGCSAVSVLRRHCAYFGKACTKGSELLGQCQSGLQQKAKCSWILFASAVLLFCKIMYDNRAVGTGLLGAVLLPAAVYLLSTARDLSVVNWDTVLGGVALQMHFAMFGLKYSFGRGFLGVLGDVTTRFFGCARSGALMVFSERIVDPTGQPGDMPFCFSVLPTVIFFAACVGVAYYLGVMQKCILGVSAVLRRLLGVSTIEAASSAANIFLGMTEVPLALKPLLPLTSHSELHAMLVCGFGSVAATILPAYAGFGVDPDYLILSCMMSAPAALALSKLACPADAEEDASAEAEEDNAARTAEALRSKDGSVVEAAGNGASNALPLVGNIAAMLIAVNGLMACLDGLTGWLFRHVGCDLSLSALMGYVMSPCAFIMGVPMHECRQVGLLLAKKLLINELVAFRDLGIMIQNRGQAGLAPQHIDGLDGIVTLSPHSEVISTFALCNFANIGSVGVTFGALCALCPERRSEIAPLMTRTMLVGFAVGLLNGCVAGVLIRPDL